MAVLDITKENFEAEVSAKFVILDFWAKWCAPCRKITPFIEEIAMERSDITVGKIDIDEQPELAIKYGVTGIPTLVFIREGEEVARMIGAQKKKTILEKAVEVFG